MENYIDVHESTVNNFLPYSLLRSQNVSSKFWEKPSTNKICIQLHLRRTPEYPPKRTRPLDHNFLQPNLTHAHNQFHVRPLDVRDRSFSRGSLLFCHVDQNQLGDRIIDHNQRHLLAQVIYKIIYKL